VARMAARNPSADELVDASDSALLIVDVQEGFLAKIEEDRRAAVVGRIVFLAEAAAWLEIPIVATVETPEDWGGLHTEIGRALPDLTPVRKEVFALGHDPNVWPVVRALDRRTLVLCGLETDVCVAQSALSLVGHGYEVVGVGDAMASPGAPHEYGLERMKAAGVRLLSTKQLHYEWMRTVPNARRFRAERPDVAIPPGMIP